MAESVGSDPLIVCLTLQLYRQAFRAGNLGRLGRLGGCGHNG